MRIALVVPITIGVLALSCLGLRSLPGPVSLPGAPFASETPLVFAHRGGMGLWPENTLHGFRAALALGVDVLEIDLRRTADGRLVVFHDADLDRTTNGEGPLAARPLAELAQLDAGYHFSPDGGRTHPFRGRGLGIPTLAEVFQALPGVRLSVELKDGGREAAESLCTLVEAHQHGERLLVASFQQDPIDAFRAFCPAVATAMTPREAWRFFAASMLGLTNLLRPRAAALFLFERLGPFQPVTRRLVSDAAALNLPIYVWGAEDDAVSKRLLEAGVSGIATDRPDRLLALLRRSDRPPLPAATLPTGGGAAR